VTGITIARDPVDPIAASRPVTWAIERLALAFEARGMPVRNLERSEPAVAESPTVSVAGANDPTAAALVNTAGAPGPSGPESFAIVPSANDELGILLCGADVRGLVYAVLEIADRVEHAEDAWQALREDPLVAGPANEVRSVTRLFCSEAADKAWFHDEAFWDRYLSMLIGQRFNRFSLTFGLGYNYHRAITDAYLYFAYPFLLSVAGHDVRVLQLPDEERERNLRMLRFISEQAVARGLDFQLGLWTHAYEWIDSPDAHHTIEGLTADRHAAYCRDAVEELLQACPAIGGLTFRIHGESGVPEGSWDFWRTVFSGVAASGRTVGIDLHAKGLDELTLRHALDTGLPVTVSPKFWAEHMGLPYHQAAIRELERPVRDDPSAFSEWHRYMSVSEGSRPFTRYGYADFLREDRQYNVVFRLWAGTQRLLLWGDPAIAAGYGRVSSLAGTNGLEWCEPLTFAGREGTGRAGSRTGYADPSLVPTDDWEKYAYAYRLFGRLSYDPETPPEQWRRSLRGSFGSAAPDAEAALASASRILPLVTTAHHPSASNNYFWPELYTDIPIVWSEEGTRPHPYLDTPTPRRFGTVGPLDPEVFSSVSDFVRELRAGEPSGRVSPLRVAEWLDRLAEDAARRLDDVDAALARPDAEARRWIIDVRILAALGRFFAGKLRSAVCYEMHTATGSGEALQVAIEAYGIARRAWMDASTRSADVYLRDLAFGPQPWLRGHWADRMPAIDADLQDMEGRCGPQEAEVSAGDRDARRLLDPATRSLPRLEVHHAPPYAFRASEPLELRLHVRGDGADRLRRVTLRYRPMNQALPFAEQGMEREGSGFLGCVPGADLGTSYPLAYAFVLRDIHGTAWRYPGLGDDLSGQPYFTVRARDRTSDDDDT